MKRLVWITPHGTVENLVKQLRALNADAPVVKGSWNVALKVIPVRSFELVKLLGWVFRQDLRGAPATLIYLPAI